MDHDQSRFPRKVSTPSGRVRWQGESGATFDSYDDAERDRVHASVDISYQPLPESPPTLIYRIYSFAILLFVAAVSSIGFFAFLAGVYQEADTFEPLAWLGIPLVAGLILMVAMLSSAAVYDRVLGKEGEETAYKKALATWTGIGDLIEGAFKYGIFLILGIVAIVLLYMVAQEVFEGIPKGQVMIIFLLIAIFWLLLSRRPAR